MSSKRRKNFIKRILLGLVQHMAMALAALVVVMVFEGSVIRVKNLQEDEKQFRLNPFDSARYFEETDIYTEMFYNAVSDIATLVVFKSQFETDGVYDGDRLVDVTGFVNRREQVSDCPITAYYRLEDLVKWGKAGAEMYQKSLTKKEFVNYFNDNLMDISHFYLDPETEALRYSGTAFSGPQEQARQMLPADVVVTDENEAYWDLYMDTQLRRLEEVYGNYQQYNEDQLVEMAFSYTASHMDKPIALEEKNGEDMVVIQLLVPRYNTEDGKQLQQAAGDWINYSKLEINVVETLESLTNNYEIYESRNELYTSENTNLRYLYRVKTEDGFQDYSNLDLDFTVYRQEDIDTYFQNIGSYLIYSVEDIICESNVNITDEDMMAIIETHDYVYPPGSFFWVGIPDEYSVVGDQFWVGRQAFDRVVLHVRDYVAMVSICLLIWLLLWCFLTFTAGRQEDRRGQIVIRINGFDKIYTEFVLLLGAGLVYLGRYCLDFFLINTTDQLSRTEDYLLVLSGPLKWAAYSIGAAFGFLASMFFCIIWYSFVRRIKYGNLWTDSLLHWLFHKVYRGISMILYHKSTAVRTLIPYNLYLMANLFGIAMAFFEREKTSSMAAMIFFVLVFDAMIGVVLFRKNAEMGEIVEAIKRIRQGEVEYQLESERMHGENQEIAEAVNNIGEGIRNAVATSVKDERLKSDLITNVSHDIKTPLTSIINYVDLLKREHIEQEPAKGYIEILDTKTQRLKQLTDDLVEASKISSGNIVLRKERINLTELLSQSVGEFMEKFEEKNLTLVYEQKSRDAFILADSRRMWRVVENLFNNIYKYALPGTRVYLEIWKKAGVVEMSIKNISSQQLNISPEELTERFIRGDESRTTEGSGLGLSITKNLVELQGGSFEILLDGDLFKTMIRFGEFQGGHS